MITLHLNDWEDRCPYEDDRLRFSVRYDGKMIPFQMCEAPFVLDGILHVKAFVGGIDLDGKPAPEDIPYQVKPHRVFYKEGDFEHGVYYFDASKVEPVELVKMISAQSTLGKIHKKTEQPEWLLTKFDELNEALKKAMEKRLKKRIDQMLDEAVKEGLRNFSGVILVPVKGRISQVITCMKHLNEIIDGYDVDVVMAVDNENEFYQLYKAIGKRFVALICREGQTLAAKKNQAVNFILDQYQEKDYLMELDSTGAISPYLFAKYNPFFERHDLFFGINRIAFIDSDSGRLLDYSLISGGVWVTGRCIRMDLVRDTVIEKGNLWNNNLKNGLGEDQERRIGETILAKGYLPGQHLVKIVNSEAPLALDIKTGDDVTPFEVLAAHTKRSNNNEVQEITDEETRQEIMAMFL